MDHNLSSLTFENSYFFKRGRRIAKETGKGIDNYDPLGDKAKLNEEAYNSIVLPITTQQLLIDAIARDLSRVSPPLDFPQDANFKISTYSILYSLAEYLQSTLNIPILVIIIYALDLFYLKHPEIMNKHLPPEPIAGGSRRRTRRMRGGSMPLSYFTDAPRVGSTEPTGVGYGSSSFSNSGWIRAPIDQTGGSRYRSRHPPAFHAVGGRYRSHTSQNYVLRGATRYRSRQPFGRFRSHTSQNYVLRGARYSHKGASRYRSRQPFGRFRSQTSQNYVLRGGFAPSIMGSFASNGLRLLPLAGYLGYNQFKNFSSSKKSNSRRSSRSKRRSK